MTSERLLNEWTNLGTRMGVILRELAEDCGLDSREAAIAEELSRLLHITPSPTKEQVLQWEAERLAERKARE